MKDEHTVSDIDEQTLSQLIKLVHKHTGITLTSSKKVMLQGRIKPRLRALNLLGYREYLAYLESHLIEIPLFIDQMTTNETYFYRTPRIWSYLEKEFIPQWINANPGVTFHAWSAAASSGEEAHTLGIILQHIKSKYPAFKYQIVGSDISDEILSLAHKGEYSGRSIELFKNQRPELFKTYMKPSNTGSYATISDIRQNIKFRKHNLFGSLKSIEKFDLVLLRNVLIYFISADQELVLFNIAQAMKPKAELIIGESESLNSLKTQFGYKMPLTYHRLAEKKEDAA